MFTLCSDVLRNASPLHNSALIASKSVVRIAQVLIDSAVHPNSRQQPQQAEGTFKNYSYSYSIWHDKAGFVMQLARHATEHGAPCN
jgi:hypothetical protein